jgi:hypothetical protein
MASHATECVNSALDDDQEFDDRGIRERGVIYAAANRELSYPIAAVRAVS